MEAIVAWAWESAKGCGRGAQRPLGHESEADLLEGQQAHEERVPLGRIAHAPPVDESALGGGDDVQHLDPGELTTRVVVRLVAALLQVDEGWGDADDLVLKRQPVEPGLSLGDRLCSANWRATRFITP